jgi:hypothetical protein
MKVTLVKQLVSSWAISIDDLGQRKALEKKDKNLFFFVVEAGVRTTTVEVGVGGNRESSLGASGTKGRSD